MRLRITGNEVIGYCVQVFVKEYYEWVPMTERFKTYDEAVKVHDSIKGEKK